MLEGPFIFYSKPSYVYNDYLNKYVGSTRLIDNFFGFMVTIFGLFIALFRIRDKLIRMKIKNIYY